MLMCDLPIVMQMKGSGYLKQLCHERLLDCAVHLQHGHISTTQKSYFNVTSKLTRFSYFFCICVVLFF